MGLEPREPGRSGRQEANPQGKEPTGGPKQQVKSFDIPKRLIVEAWEKVRANDGAPGVDAASIADFAADEANNLYMLWNRMSSGSYLPRPVRVVEIPKDHGTGVRVLGVPTVVDRIAQTAAAMLLEEKLEPIFHPDSDGYRPGRDGHDALAKARQRCWKQDWVLDLDIRKFFRQRSPWTPDGDGATPHRLALDPAVHRAVAGSPHADARRDPRRAGEGNPPGLSYLALVGQLVHALCVRHLDGPAVPELSLRALRR